MPHSSGGGSSHGGSHHSSSHSSSHSYGSSTSSAPRVSRNYFSGSRTYVRYVNRRPQYYYSDSSRLGTSKATMVFTIAFISLFVLVGVLLLFGSFNHPTKLSSAGVSSSIIEIDDQAEVLGDVSDLRLTLQQFYDTTGIIPAIVTVKYSDWNSAGYSLERYAYNWYVSSWSDEKHWLIMYSENPNAVGDKFGDWYFEGMQGDDTDNIITESVADDFTDKLHSALLAVKDDKAIAFDRAFRLILPDIMKTTFNWDVGGFALMWTAISGIILISMIASFASQGKKYSGYKEVHNVQMQPNNVPLEDVCAYCDGVYVVGTVLNCPHCGAAIPAHNPIGGRV